MRQILLVLLFTLSLLVASDKSDLKRAHSWLTQNTTKSILKAYHEYKNIRINAIMEDNKHLKIKALQGVVKAGKLLDMNIQKYQNELKNLQGIKNTTKQISKNNNIPMNSIKSIQWRHGHIVLHFSSKVLEEQVKYFVLDKKFKKNYRYIFDMSAQSKHALHIQRKSLVAIRISKHSKSIRLVLESKKSLSLRYSRRGRELIIDLNAAGKAPKTTLSTPSTNKVDTSTKVIVIDAGHGGRDSGAVGYKRYREKIIVFQIAKRLKAELKMIGYKVYMTRSSDKYIKLRKRTAYANRKKADLFISIHANSVVKKGNYKKHYGIETYYLARTSSKRAKNVAATENSKDVETMNHFSKESFLSLLNTQKILASTKLAIDLQRGMLGELRKKFTKIKDGGVKKGPFWVLVGAQMPAVLVEVGFLTSPKEARNLVNAKYQQNIAHGLAQGVRSYFKHNQ